MALLTSCSSELGEVVNNGDIVEKVTIKTKPFEYDAESRTSLTAMSNGISFAWSKDDVLGVFPVSPTTNNQARQALNINPENCEDDGHYATFDGAGWALKKGNSYAAYTPYNGDLSASTPYTAVPVKMTGQDGTLTTIGKKYDYMYAPSSFVSEDCADGTTHEVVFDFNHAVSIIQLRVVMPVAATWKSIQIKNAAGDKVWITSGNMNVATGEVTPTVTTSAISLSLTDVTTTDASKTLAIYVAALPTTTGELTFSATTTDNKSYTATISSLTLEAGRAYYRWVRPKAQELSDLPDIYYGVIHMTDISPFMQGKYALDDYHDLAETLNLNWYTLLEGNIIDVDFWWGANKENHSVSAIRIQSPICSIPKSAITRGRVYSMTTDCIQMPSGYNDENKEMLFFILVPERSGLSESLQVLNGVSYGTWESFKGNKDNILWYNGDSVTIGSDEYRIFTIFSVGAEPGDEVEVRFKFI